jgi:cysteine dioxygenase
MPTSNPNIHSLKDLIIALNCSDKNHSNTAVLKEIKFGFREIEHLCFWDRDNYSKISIEKNEGCELVLICWEKDQQSPIHSHDLDEAWTYILKGELTEEIYNSSDNSALENTIVLNPKDVSSIKKESNKVHRLINTFDGRSVSLHLYKK